MTLGDLLALYAAAGVASAVIVYRASPEPGRTALASALLAVPLWPLWLPVALAARAGAAPGRAFSADSTQAAIWEAHRAVAGSGLEPVLSRETALRIVQEVDRASERHRELVVLLGQRQFSLQAAEAHVAKLAQDGEAARSLAPARLHLENVRRLEGLRRRDEQTLEELAELARALRTQLVLARYAGSTPLGANDIVSEVWARVEVLGTTLEAPDPPAFTSAHASDEARTVGG